MIGVVHVVVAGEIGGAERMLVELISRPEETGARHCVALITPNPALSKLFCTTGARVHERGPSKEGPLPFLRRSFGRRDVHWIADVIASEDARIAHLHTFGSHVVGTRAAMRAGARILRTEHSTRAYDDPTCWPFTRWALARADASVAVSEHVRRAAVRRAPWAARIIEVVPNGVDVERFAPRDMALPSPFTLLFVGRLEHRKGADLAIRALSQVEGARLDIVGDGPERAALEALTRRSGLTQRVTFHGFVADPRDALARCDVAIVTSRAEGLGIASIEAMAMARPVVGFAVGGIPEVVLPGRTGLLVSPGNVAGLAGALRAAMMNRDALRATGREARAHVVRHFSAERMREGYAKAYEILAESRKSC